MWLINKFNIILPFTYFGKTIQQIEIVAAINGGDGFADIYGNNIFKIDYMTLISPSNSIYL